MLGAKIEVGDIFRRYGNIYRDKYGLRMSVNQLQAMKAIEICRTAELGGHVYECDECGKIHITYNSCRNRHCPKCQSLPTEKWLLARKNDLLPINYFHVVFTLPDKLNSLIYINQKILYGLLFKAASQTILELTKDKKYLGSQVGITAILHTWGQNLLFHPHLHCLVTGGGLTKNNEKWISARKNYFLPVKVMSKKFKGKFLYLLEKEFENKSLKFKATNKDLNNPKKFKQFINKIKLKKWVVFCKSSLKKSENIINYFGRYTYRVAISNNRIIKIKNDKVYFKWKNYNDNNTIKVMSIAAIEFIRRFLLHILPKKFMKIRYYGFLANCHKREKLTICRRFLIDKVNKCDVSNSTDNLNWKDLFFKITGRDITICPSCKKGRMILVEILEPLHNNSPPKRKKAA